VPGLVGELFVGDLNPSAVDLLRDNIDFPSATIECVDARELKTRTEMCNKFDLLLVNIPHDSLEHLSSLTPLVKEHGIVRGWAVIEDDDFENAKEHLKEIFDNTYTIEIRRSYSATANLCRFEGQITL
jgi:tRNA G37 N-methylase Trm5